MKLPPITPRWLTYERASAYSSLSTRTLESHVKAGLIQSRNVCTPGRKRGRRLIDRESLDSFIEGSSSDASPLVINSRPG